MVKEQSSVKTLRQQINESLKKDVSISSSFDSINPDALVNATASNYGSHVSMASKLSNFKKGVPGGYLYTRSSNYSSIYQHTRNMSKDSIVEIDKIENCLEKIDKNLTTFTTD